MRDNSYESSYHIAALAIQSYVLNRVFNQGPTVLIAYTIVVVFSKIRFFFSFVDHGVESAARLVLLEH